jgi:PAS domain S-box-containing protein
MFDADQIRDQLATVADPVSLLVALFAESPFPFAIFHVDGHCLVVNPPFRELFGTVPPPAYDIFKDELVQALGILPDIQRAFGGEPVLVPAFWYDARKLEHVRVEGRRVAVELSLTPVKEHDGAVRYVVLVYKDVTAKLELENERGLLRTLFEVAPEAIVICDLDSGRLDDANDNAVRLFGRSREALLALGLSDLSPARQPDGRWSGEVIAEHVARALCGERLELEWMLQTVAGDELPCEVRLVQVPARGRTLCRVSLIDLRARKLTEAERERGRQLEEQNLRIHEANRLKSEFLAAMSHELRTPLNTIIGFAELVFYGSVAPDSPEHDEFIGDILSSSRHLLQLINDVLDLARVEAGKLEFRPEPVVIEAVIAEVAGLLRTMSLQKRIRMRIEVDHSIKVVVLDPVRFKQVLYNYLSNALKFTPEGGNIVVRTSPETPGLFRLEVEDSGIGIAPDQIKRLFLEFEQLDTGPNKPPGTGLGLALTRRLVEAQGGSVGVRSSFGHGSVFHAVLPRETHSILVR